MIISGKTVKEMLIKIGVTIAKYTDQRRAQDTYITDRSGKMKGINVCLVFDKETQTFLSSYITKGETLEWIERCNKSSHFDYMVIEKTFFYSLPRSGDFSMVKSQ